MPNVNLIFGDDDVAAKRLLERHLRIKFEENRGPLYVEPNVRQFPTMALLMGCHTMAQIIVDKERQNLKKLVILGFDDPQNPPQFGTMLANLIAFNIHTITGHEPGRVHVRREVERGEDGKVKREYWQKYFFNGTNLRQARMVFVTDVVRAGSMLRHLIKTAVGKDYQDLHYRPDNHADVARGINLVSSIFCLALWDPDVKINRDLARSLGFAPPIYAFAPGSAQDSAWGNSAAGTSGTFRSFQAPDRTTSDGAQ